MQTWTAYEAVTAKTKEPNVWLTTLITLLT